MKFLVGKIKKHHFALGRKYFSYQLALHSVHSVLLLKAVSPCNRDQLAVSLKTQHVGLASSVWLSGSLLHGQL